MIFAARRSTVQGYFHAGFNVSDVRVKNNYTLPGVFDSVTVAMTHGPSTSPLSIIGIIKGRMGAGTLQYWMIGFNTRPLSICHMLKSTRQAISLSTL